MYGSGLYTAVDPVVTENYGGQDWRLTQIRFPIGTRVLDLANPDTVNVKDSVLVNATYEIEEKFGCPRASAADPYFVNGGVSLSEACRSLISEVFNSILQIDAFAYGYGDTSFRACESGMYMGSRAFVVTRADWMRSEYVHYYTKNSRLNEEERLRIQTLLSWQVKKESTRSCYSTSSLNILTSSPIVIFEGPKLFAKVILAS
ncbi:MAG: hypothetical protein IPK68_04705 [Bdellovibrionales bacterium]|nr:hypothetical protein [Bdellovibrionales bacterium]